MDAALQELLSERAGALADGVQAALLAHDAPHYKDVPLEILRRRCESLVSALLEALASDGADPFVRYVRRIAQERVAEGFLLREVLKALSALEAEVWPLVSTAGGDTSLVVRRLAIVTGIVGRGKDELAGAFLDEKERCDARAAQLQLRLASLFSGTEPPPEA